MAVFVEPPHHATGCIQAKRAAAGQQDRMHLLNRVFRPQQVGFSGAWGTTANRRAAHHTLWAQHDGAPGVAAGFRCMCRMADGQPGDVSQRAWLKCLGQAKTPAVSCMRADTSPRWNWVSPRLISSIVRRLK